MFINASSTDQSAYVESIAEILGFTPEESLVIYSPTTPRAVAVIPLHDLDPDRIGRSVSVALNQWEAIASSDVVTVFFSDLPELLLTHLDEVVREQYKAYSARHVGTFYIASQSVADAPPNALVPPASDNAQSRARAAYDAAEPDFSEYLRGLDHVRHGGTVPAEVIGAAARCLGDIQMRDMACVLLTGTGFPQECIDDSTALDATVAGHAMDRIVDPDLAWKPSEALSTHVELLTAVVAHMPDETCAPARTLLGLAAWWQGNNPLALGHLHHALNADPDYRLARLVTATIQMVVDPGWLSESSTSRQHSPQH